MVGNTKLRVGSRNFEQALDLWHSGTDAHIRPTAGNVVIESDTSITGVLRTRPTTPASSSSTCENGQIVWDENFIYVCTVKNRWKRAELREY